MSEEGGLAPHLFAGLVAPAVERLHHAATHAVREHGGTELCQRYGGPLATGFLVEFRTRLAAPGGTVSGPGFAAVTRYLDPVARQRALDKQVAHGMIHRRADGSFLATERGAAFLTELHQLHGDIVSRLWAGHDDRVHQLVELLGRLLAAALDDPEPLDVPALGGEHPGAAFATMAPPYEPDGTPPELRLMDRLGALCHHRADAYAAAWTSAGHTAASIGTLAAGPERLAIEQETDRRAGAAYAALAPTERLAMLADLAALPG